MRIRTQRVVLVASLALSGSCATTAPTLRPRESNSALSALHTRQAQQAARIEELEARISLLESDARRARSQADATQRVPEAVRIGATRNPISAAVADDELETTAKELPASKRPRLRLYGRQSGEDQAAVPPVPIVSETLPVAPLPTARSSVRPPVRANAAVTDAALANYLEGLRFLRERRFDAALTAFGAFIADYPEQDLVPNALYWRGEAHYAKREYVQARSEFEALLARFPRSEKAADSLLKLALCFRQLGSEEQARGAFRRLRTEYPNSQAASVAAREGAT